MSAIPDRYKKKPVKVDAIEFTADNGEAIAFWCGGIHETVASDPTTESQWITLPTLQGNVKASLGDYVIKGVDGAFSSEKPDVFAATYDLVVN